MQNPLHLPRKTTSARPKVLRTCQFFTLLTSKCASRHNGVHISTCQLPKVVREWCALHILTWKCASRHKSMHFFDISISKSAPKLRCFVHCGFEMCSVPQPRAIFHFSSGQMASHLCFSEPTLRPSAATSHLKNTVNRDFSTSSCACIFFLLTLSLLCLTLSLL